MPSLLISLGTTPAIVPEAFHLPDVDFSAVHVITTDGPKIAASVEFVRKWFSQNAPEVMLTITHVAGFGDFSNEEDHFRFEEILFRWMLEHADGQIYVSIAGGYKTMSAAMQKAAAIFGAAEVFHVLCPKNPSTDEEIAAALKQNEIHWVRLGPESGWPQLRVVASTSYPLTTAKLENHTRWVECPNHTLRNHVRSIVERSHRIADSWEILGNFPFQDLATWTTADIDWLMQPLNASTEAAWISSLPKVELHSHLGGFATHGSLLAQVRAAADGTLVLLEEHAFPDSWPLPDKAISLNEYMKLGDANGSALLFDPGCLKKQCELLYQNLLEQNVCYAEIRCSPANYTSTGRSSWQVLSDIKHHFDECMNAHTAGSANFPTSRCHINLIVIATRKDKGDYRAAISRHLALAVTAAEHWTNQEECRVVGVDLAGFEDATTRAHYFREEFSAVHRCGLALTAHAGEIDDAEAIWRAVFDLNARRLGHALHLIDSPELLQSVAARGIGVEMCPYANAQIKGYHLRSKDFTYPLKIYLDRRVCVSINTDNIGISAASLSENFLLAAQLCPDLTRMDLLQLIANAVDMSFLPPAAKNSLKRFISSSIQPGITKP